MTGENLLRGLLIFECPKMVIFHLLNFEKHLWKRVKPLHKPEVNLFS